MKPCRAQSRQLLLAAGTRALQTHDDGWRFMFWFARGSQNVSRAPRAVAYEYDVGLVHAGAKVHAPPPCHGVGSVNQQAVHKQAVGQGSWRREVVGRPPRHGCLLRVNTQVVGGGGNDGGGEAAPSRMA